MRTALSCVAYRQASSAATSARVDLTPLYFPLASSTVIAEKVRLVAAAEEGLSGSLPPALFHRRGRLRELRGARCALGGSLPCAQLAGAVGLGHLDVAENGIEGKLCRGMAGLPGLTWLSLGSNKLEGAIPLALATLPSLRLFNVSGNERLSWVEFV